MLENDHTLTLMMRIMALLRAIFIDGAAPIICSWFVLTPYIFWENAMRADNDNNDNNNNNNNNNNNILLVSATLCLLH